MVLQKSTANKLSINSSALSGFAWDDLRYFLAVAQTGSLSAASKQLSVNHSTVFRRIQMLEERLQIPLFHRSKEGYLLNDAGVICQQYANEMAEQLEQMQMKLSGSEQSLTGKISITAIGAITESILIPAMAAFQVQQPEICFELISSRQSVDLRSGAADIALRFTDQPPEYLIGHKLMEVPWRVFAGQHFFDQYPCPSSWQQAEQLPWIAMDASISTQATRWFNKRIPQKKVVVQSNDVEVVAAAAAANMGLAYLPDAPHFSKYALQSLPQLMGEPEQLYYSQLWLLVHPDLKGSAKVMSFYRFLIQFINQNRTESSI